MKRVVLFRKELKVERIRCNQQSHFLAFRPTPSLSSFRDTHSPQVFQALKTFRTGVA